MGRSHICDVRVGPGKGENRHSDAEHGRPRTHRPGARLSAGHHDRSRHDPVAVSEVNLNLKINLLFSNIFYIKYA